MTVVSVEGGRARRGFSIPQKYAPVLTTFALFVVMFTAGSIRYEDFASAQIVLNILIDNAFLLVVAIGMTFVILTGGIDLSVGAVVALSTVLCATFVQQKGWSPVIVLP